MKIVFINRYFAPDESATSQLLTDVATDLAAGGWQVHVICCRHLHDAPHRRLLASDRVRGVHVHRIWTSGFGRDTLSGRTLDYLTFYVSVLWRLVRLVRPGDIVVAKTDPPLLSLVAAPVALLRRATLVNWLQDIFPEIAVALVSRPEVRRGAALLKGIRNASLRVAAVNVTLGQRMAHLVEGLGVERHRIRIIENWADGAALQPLPARCNPLRDEWGVAGRLVIGYSGNMGRAHEFGTLLDAAELLRQEQDIVFVLIGGGARKGWIADNVRHRRLDNVILKPYQPREGLAASLSVPDIHLISLWPALEGLIVPSKLYGSAAVGRPIVFIGDPDGEVAAFIREVECGATVRIGEAEALAALILRLHRSPVLREQWGHNARSAFMARNDRPIALAAWQHLLQQLSSVRTPMATPVSVQRPSP